MVVMKVRRGRQSPQVEKNRNEGTKPSRGTPGRFLMRLQLPLAGPAILSQLVQKSNMEVSGKKAGRDERRKQIRRSVVCNSGASSSAGSGTALFRTSIMRTA